jgi:hypothetical protein
LKQWSNYLVSDSLISANQISTDGFAGSLAKQTNLALKGVIGIQAMSVIGGMTRNTVDAQKFPIIAQSYVTQWQQ